MKPPGDMPARISMTGADRLLEAVAAGVLVVIVAGAFVGYARLPARVPLHFDLRGIPDGWGSRASVFLLPAVAAAVYAVMTAVSRARPWFWRVPALVTPENSSRVYSATSRLMRIMKVEVMLLVGVVLWLVVASARAEQTRGGWIALGGAILLVVTAIAGLSVARRRARR